jgi:hypothetical protein
MLALSTIRTGVNTGFVTQSNQGSVLRERRAGVPVIQSVVQNHRSTNILQNNKYAKS